MFKSSHVVMSMNPQQSAIKAACDAVDAVDPLGMGSSLWNTFCCHGYVPKTYEQKNLVQLAMLDGAAAEMGCGDPGTAKLFKAAYFGLVDSFTRK